MIENYLRSEKEQLRFQFDSSHKNYLKKKMYYSVMLSDGNSFCGDVALAALTWYTVIKAAFKTNNMKKKNHLESLL